MGAIGRIIDHYHQHCPRAAPFKPVVIGAIHLHQLSKAWPALSPLPVLLAATLDDPIAALQKPAPQCLMVHLQPIPNQMLASQRRTKTFIALLITDQHSLLKLWPLSSVPATA